MLSDNQHYYPLSFQQEMTWKLSALGSNTPLWSIHSSMLLEGELNIDLFKCAVRKLLRRHEILRAGFTTRNNKVVQFIRPLYAIDPYCSQFDVSYVSESKKNLIKTTSEKIVAKPFDLFTDHLFRIAIIKTSKYEQIIVLVMHHMISDETSIKIAWQDLSLLYNASNQNKAVSLLPLYKQYYDFAIWQHDISNIEYYNRLENYWHEKFTGDLPVLDLSRGHTRLLENCYNAQTQYGVIGECVTKKLRSFCFRTKVSMFSVLLSMYYFLLSKFTSPSDIIIGTLFAGRNIYKEAQSMIGLFCNVLPMRFDFSKEIKMSELIREIDRIVVMSYEKQDYSFAENINMEWQTKTGSSLFSALFNKLNQYPDHFDFQGLQRKKWNDVDLGLSFDALSMTIYEYNSKLIIKIEYYMNLFETETIKELIDEYQRLIEIIVGDISIQLKDI